MKISVVLFLLFVSGCFGQQHIALVTTLYHDNGQMEISFEYDSITNQYCGYYKKYTDQGTLLENGNYKRVDSVQCKDCYDFNLWNGVYKPYKYAKIESVKTGVWEYYYPNGKLQMLGSYAEMVHAHLGSPALIANEGPVNVWISYDDLKEGDWNYFDESGKKLRTETYVDGALIYTLNYE